MDIIGQFRHYLRAHYPDLDDDRWLVDGMSFNKEQLKSEHLKAKLPKGITTFKCYFFAHEPSHTAIYLIADQEGKEVYDIYTLNIS
ncbi:hypothetical protein [Sporolactobacillus sp. KGMB 08714]|uniref:hypothetical protein n=1 Tax=Sporolactobacillus sp. KGMB 08714 TaxID=3064704 RepID=UPI002FBD8BFB